MRKLAAFPGREARARSAWQYLGTTSTAIAVLATLAKHDIASPARVPISTMSRPANLRASAVCTASGERMGEMSTGKTNAAQSTLLTDCRSWRCASLGGEARPRNEVKPLPSMTMFAKVGPTETNSSANAPHTEWDRRIARGPRGAELLAPVFRAGSSHERDKRPWHTLGICVVQLGTRVTRGSAGRTREIRYLKSGRTDRRFGASACWHRVHTHEACVHAGRRGGGGSGGAGGGCRW